MRKENKGFTLVELIVVIAIMSVLLGLIAVSIAPMFTQAVKGSADNLQAKLADTRTASYAKNGSNTYLKLTVDSDNRLYGTVIINGVEQETERLSRYSESVAWERGDATSLTKPSNVLGTGSTLYVAFSKGTGEIVYCDTTQPTSIPSSATGAIDDLVISLSRDKIQYNVNIDALTGTAKIKRIRS